MNNLIEKLKAYIDETLGVSIGILPWKDQKKLPFFLLDAYDFFETSLLNQLCLFIIEKKGSAPAPNTIQKNWEQITKKWNGPCIYVSDTTSSYNRKRLIQNHIPFIVPNSQLYIPDVGLDLHEHFQKQRVPKVLFSPAAQATIIHTLRSEEFENVLPSGLASKLGYSFMTMTRVFNELESAGVGNVTKKGKERLWNFEGTKKELWEQTKNMLRSPIKSRKPMKLQREGLDLPEIRSGMSALSEITMLNPPRIPVFAIGLEEYFQLDVPKGILDVVHSDDATFELEIWHYNPRLFSERGVVDPFSLYLSLREASDERIEIALEELMEKVKW